MTARPLYPILFASSYLNLFLSIFSTSAHCSQTETPTKSDSSTLSPSFQPSTMSPTTETVPDGLFGHMASWKVLCIHIAIVGGTICLLFNLWWWTFRLRKSEWEMSDNLPSSDEDENETAPPSRRASTIYLQHAYREIEPQAFKIVLQHMTTLDDAPGE